MLVTLNVEFVRMGISVFLNDIGRVTTRDSCMAPHGLMFTDLIEDGITKGYETTKRPNTISFDIGPLIVLARTTIFHMNGFHQHVQDVPYTWDVIRVFLLSMQGRTYVMRGGMTSYDAKEMSSRFFLHDS